MNLEKVVIAASGALWLSNFSACGDDSGPNGSTKCNSDDDCGYEEACQERCMNCGESCRYVCVSTKPHEPGGGRIERLMPYNERGCFRENYLNGVNK